MAPPGGAGTSMWIDGISSRAVGGSIYLQIYS